jgi:Protein of unknown function (DUF2613)
MKRPVAGRFSDGRPLDRHQTRRRVIMTRVGVIVASVIAGILLAAGAAYGVTALATGPQTPANQSPYNYGTP